MAHKTFHVAPAELIEGDPFALHEPLTLDDLDRIEKTLADGSVTGAEADRLRAIRDAESEKLAEAFKGITAVLNDHFGDVPPKMDFVRRLADLIPKVALGPRLADLIPTVDLGPRLTDLTPKVDFRPWLTDLMPKGDHATLLDDIARPQLPSLGTIPVVKSMLDTSAIEPMNFDLLVDERTAHMEELAESQLAALTAACASLEATASAIVKSDHRAEERFAESKRMNHSQTRTVVIATIIAALLSGLAGAALATILQIHLS